MAEYIALLRKILDSEFSVDFPDFPECFTAGYAIDEAKDMSVEALTLHIEGIIKDGLPLPSPSSLESIMSDPHNSRAVAFLVHDPTATEKAVRVNVTFPESILHKIDAKAKELGMTRSGFLKDAAVKELDMA